MENTPRNPFSDSDENTRNNTSGNSLGNTFGTSDDNLTGNDSLTRDASYTSGSFASGNVGGEALHTPTVGSSSSNFSTTNAASSGSRMLTGMFKDRDSAERAYGSLQSRGYTDKDINLMMSDETRKKHFSKDHDSALGNKAMEGAGVGSAIGGTLGAIVAAIAAAGTAVALPGLGLVIAGPIAAGLAGAGAGGLTGGILGALVGSGIPEDRAKEYEEGIKEGGIVMGVNARSDEDASYLESEWRNSRGEKIYR